VAEREEGKERPTLLDEHIGSRKDWGEYVRLITKIRFSDVQRNDEFLAALRTRIEQALRRTR
jgi:hypothetical protein